MEYLIWFFLPMILLLGTVTSYTDIKFGKIRNKWVLAGLLYGLVVMSLIFAFYKLNGMNPTLTLEGAQDSFSFIKETYVNFIIAIVISILLWVNNVWSAADAKLFMAFAILTPVNVYKIGYVRLFPSIVIIVNAFVLILVVTLYQLLRGNKDNILIAMKNFLLEPKSIAVSAALIFIIQWVFSLFFNLLGLQQSILSLLLMLLVVIKIFGKVITRLNSKNEFILVGLVLLRLVIDSNIYTVDYLVGFVMIVVLFVFVRLFLEKLASRSFSYKVPITKLKQGMILTKSLVKPVNKKKYEFMNEEEKNKTRVDTLVHPTSEGLTTEELDMINDVYEKGMVKNKQVQVASQTYFGPYIFAGTLIAIILKGNIIIIIPYVLQQLF